MRWGVLASDQAGFTLIEILVTALIVVLISAGVAQALISSTDFSAHQRFRSQADQVAQQDQERLKAMSDQQLTALNQSRTVTLSNIPFTVRSTATFLDANGGSSCSSGSAAYFKLDSVVSWPEGYRNLAPAAITEETIVTRTVTGGILAQVNDQTGAGIPGVLVQATGQNTGENVSGVTDSSGCTLFANLPTDSYTITLAAAGYVDKDGNASPPNASVSVTQTAITAPHVALNLGLAGSMVTTFTTKNNAGLSSAPAGREVSYYGAGSPLSMTNAVPVGSPSTPSLSYTIGSLFPFYAPPPVGSSYTNNYQVWAGACQQEQPLSPLAGTNVATIGPGAMNVAANVWEPAVDLAIKYNGTYVAPTDVKLTFSGTSASTGSCTDKWTGLASIGTDTVSSVNYGVYPAPFASNAAKGSATASRTGDPGTLTLCADYKYQTSPAAYRYETSAAFTNTSKTSTTVLPVMDVLKDAGSHTGTCP